MYFKVRDFVAPPLHWKRFWKRLAQGKLNVGGSAGVVTWEKLNYRGYAPTFHTQSSGKGNAGLQGVTPLKRF